MGDLGNGESSHGPLKSQPGPALTLSALNSFRVSKAMAFLYLEQISLKKVCVSEGDPVCGPGHCLLLWT